jgi:hypothetical protein
VEIETAGREMSEIIEKLKGNSCTVITHTSLYGYLPQLTHVLYLLTKVTVTFQHQSHFRCQIYLAACVLVLLYLISV